MKKIDKNQNRLHREYGLFIKKSELARLGLRRQRMGVIEPYAVD